MSNFMEVFTVTHMTYLFIVPCAISLIALVLLATGEVLGFEAGNIFLYAFVGIFMLLVIGKSFNTLKKAPYFEVRMEQFNDSPKEFD